MRPTILTAAALLALAGCRGPAPEADGANQAGAAQPPIASPEGRADPDFSNLPQGIPAYPRVSGAAAQFGGDSAPGEMRVMGFRTADRPAAVVAFYADAARRAGFREIHRLRTGASEVLGVDRANGDVMNVTATGTPGGTNVQLMTGRGRGRR